MISRKGYKPGLIALTIDDGPSPAHTTALLDLLDRFQARATFFLIGKRAEEYPHLVTEILARGHAVRGSAHHPLHAWFDDVARHGSIGVDREVPLPSGNGRQLEIERIPMHVQHDVKIGIVCEPTSSG